MNDGSKKYRRENIRANIKESKGGNDGKLGKIKVRRINVQDVMKIKVKVKKRIE